MNYCPRPIIRRLLLRPLRVQIQQFPKLHFSATPAPAAMKSGTPIPGLEAIYPAAKDPSKSRVPTVKPREEYPSWVSDLINPLPTLAKLRNMRIEDASDKDMKRYLKLVRKAKIKQNNLDRAK